jgi:alkanesulfonate monooxygenase SsuD/methylene tetrahydromethanopterin reductase-like flavin-dependent oxidoreductase (luciferase family)
MTHAKHPFRFGVTVMPTPQTTAKAIQQTARAAANQGYAILLIPDSMFLLSPLPSLAIAASAADIRVGTLVMSSPLRPAAVSAWEAHSLSILTEGRFELGIGAGMPPSGPAFESTGLDFGSPAERIRTMAEVVDRVNTLGNGDIHITMGAGGPKTRELAARVADSVILTADPYADVTGHTEIVTGFREMAGERADRVELLSNLLIVGDDPLDMSMAHARGLDPDRLLESNAVSVLRGNVTEMSDELQRRRDILGTSYITISNQMMDQFAPVVEKLSGQ